MSNSLMTMLKQEWPELQTSLSEVEESDFLPDPTKDLMKDLIQIYILCQLC